MSAITSVALSCPGSDGAQFTVGNSVFNIHCGIDYYGNDIGRAAAATDFESCITICSASPDCVDVNWTNGNCYLKNVAISSVVDYTAWTATLASTDAVNAARIRCPTDDGLTYTTPSGDQYLISCDINYSRGDLTNQQVNSIEECITACDSDIKCTNLSYHHGFCYLKNNPGPAETEIGTWSAKLIRTTVSCPRSNNTVYTTASGDAFQIQCSTDYDGGDIPGVAYPDLSFQHCIDTCDKTVGCVGVAYHHSYCYPKDDSALAVSNPGSWAARKIDGSNFTDNLPCPSYKPVGKLVYQTNDTITAEIGGKVEAYADEAGNIINFSTHPQADSAVLLDVSDPSELRFAFPNGEGLIISISDKTVTSFGSGCSDPQTVSTDSISPTRSIRRNAIEKGTIQIIPRSLQPTIDLFLYNQCGQRITSGFVNLVCTPLSFPQTNGESEPAPGLQSFSYLTCGTGGCEGSCDINSLDQQITSYRQCAATDGRSPYAAACSVDDFVSKVFSNLGKFISKGKIAAQLGKAQKAISPIGKLCGIYHNKYVQPVLDADALAEACGFPPEIAVTATGLDFVRVLGTFPATQANIVATATSSVSSCSTSSTTSTTNTTASSTTTSDASTTNSTLSDTTTSITSSATTSVTTTISPTITTSDTSTTSSSTISTTTPSITAITTSTTTSTSFTFTAEATYVPITDECSTAQGMGIAVTCCTSACLDGTFQGQAGQCLNYLDLCLDLEGGPPSCSTAQVLLPGPLINRVDSGDGYCWGNECSWERNNWTWSCCNCPNGFVGINSGKCEDNGLDVVFVDRSRSCVGCSSGEVLAGDASNGYYCILSEEA